MMVVIMKHKPTTFFGPPLKQPRISIKKRYTLQKLFAGTLKKWKPQIGKGEKHLSTQTTNVLVVPAAVYFRGSKWMQQKNRVVFLLCWNVHGATAGWIAFQWMELFLGSFGRLVLEVGGGPIFGKLVVVSNISWIFSPWFLGKWSNLTSIFFRWVGSTTN